MEKHKVTITNLNKTFEVGSDQTIIDVVEAAGYSLPIACRYGGCITCAARLVSGSVRQPGATALNRTQSHAGYILLCVAQPKEDRVITAGVDSHTDLYTNPFASVAAINTTKTNQTK